MLTIKERTQPLTEVKANNKFFYKKKLTAEHGDGVFFSQHSPPPPPPPPPAISLALYHCHPRKSLMEENP